MAAEKGVCGVTADSCQHSAPTSMRQTSEGSGSRAQPGPSPGSHPGTATLGDLIAVARRSRAKPLMLPLRRSGPSSNMDLVHRGGFATKKSPPIREA